MGRTNETGSRRVTYRLARTSVFCALSVVGSFIHLPSPVQTVALDSAPGFLAALIFGPFDGAVVSAVGHLATSVINGFPLGILHLPIAFGLGVAGASIGILNRINYRWNLVLALVTGVLINTGLVVLAVPALGWSASLALAPFLLFAAATNAAVAGVAFRALKGRLPH